MALTVSFDYGFTEEGNEESTPDRLLLDISANDDGFLVEGNQRVRRIPPGVTGNLEIPLRLLGYSGLSVGQSVTIAKRAIGSPREPVVVGAPNASLPAQIAGGAIAFGPWEATSGGLMPVTLSAPPSAPDTITGYLVAAAGSTWAYFIEDDLAAPFDVPFSPADFPDFAFGAATFDVDLTIAARIAAGTGPASAAETVQLALTDSYFVDPADWTLTPIEDEGPAGLVDIEFLGASSFVAQSPWVTRGWVGALPEDADPDTLLPVDWATLGNTFPIAPGDDPVRVPTGVAVAGNVYGMILLHNTETGAFQPGTTRKTDTVPALTTTPPLPSLASGAVPTITGLVDHGGVMRADIGVALTGDILGGAAGWANATSRRNRFSVDAILVGSAAVDVAVAYVPVSGDENKNLILRCTGLNANGQTLEESAAVRIVRPAPAAVGSIAAQSFNINDGAKTVSAATVSAAFSGGGLVFSISSSAGATINASTGEISIPEQTAPITDAIIVTATNSGGSAQQGFSATFSEGVAAFPPSIPASAWRIVEVTNSGEAGGVVGKRKLEWTGTVVVPSGFTLHFYAGTSPTVTWTTAQVGVTPGTEYTTDSGLGVGEVYYPKLGWRRLSDGAFLTASERPSVTIQGIGTTPAALPQFLDAQYSQATGQAMTNFASNGGAGSNAGWFGRSATVEAWESLAGRTAADSHVLAQLRAWLGATTCITAKGGFTSQLELILVEVAALAKLNNRVWNGVGLASNLTPLTASEKTRITLQVQAAAIQGAYCCSTKNPDIAADLSPSRNLDGGTNWDRTNPNFSHAPSAQVYCAAAFLGASALTSFLNGLNIANFISQLNANGLTRTADTFEALPNTGSTTAKGGSAGAPNPSKVQVQNAVANWVCSTPDFFGVTISQPQQAAIAMMNRTWNRTIQSGYGGTAGNDWIGPGINGAAKMVTNASGLPNRGTIGDNFEYLASDGGGVRSAHTPYVLFNSRIVMGMLMVMAAAGQLDRSNAALQTAVARMHRGWLSADHKSQFGYISREKGVTRIFVETNTGADGGLTWTMRISASGARVRGYTNGAWFNVLHPWFTA